MPSVVTPIGLYYDCMHACQRPCMGLLTSIVAGLGNCDPTGVEDVCNKARLVSWLVSVHFLSLHFTNLIHAST